MKITSIRVDPDIAKIIEALDLPYQRVLKRGLISYGLDGKIKDPIILAAIERYQGNLISQLEAEKKILDLLIRKRTDQAGNNEDKEVKSEIGPFIIPICQYCDRDMKRDEKGLYYCTCGGYTKMKNQGLLRRSLVEREEYSTTPDQKKEYSTTQGEE